MEQATLANPVVYYWISSVLWIQHWDARRHNYPVGTVASDDPVVNAHTAN